MFEIIELLLNFGVDINVPTLAGETVFDICEDGEMHHRLLALKVEMERRQLQEQQLQAAQNRASNRQQRPLVRRRSSNNPRRQEN
ncbi:unnamed protein product [Protopolystoma xenopodis]|uniref:Uncharacterized protein n=1 Tax=Protopolystoma xenopodis TaxID=117903 RepID=A0A3S5B8V9_9PLAT|nr:unnamed protein product [Protopolystoma xenopodis]